MDGALIIAILNAAIISATPILYASLGEIFTERAGLLNLGVEGMMLIGAVTGFLTVTNTNSLLLGLLVAIISGALIGFGYMDSVINVAEKHPEVYFLHCTGFKRADNVSTYDVREYDATYLTGIVAGSMTKNGKIGYVASQPIPSVIRAIDSFALGVKAVNPEAKVQLVWTSTWYDPAKEKEAALGLLDTGVDVIAQYQDTPAVQQAAQERGALSIGFHSDMGKFAPDANLTSYVWNWGPMYVEQVKAYHDGTWKGTDIWLGMKDGVADIAPLNDKLVPEEVKTLVEETKTKLLNGEIVVFEGPLKDNLGNVIAEEGQVVSDEDLRGINWLADNILGSLPTEN